MPIFPASLKAVAAAMTLAAGLAAASPAMAVEKIAFTPAALDAAKTAGKPILVEVSAPWCPTCKAQKQVLAKLFVEPAYKDLVVFDIDFDSQKPALKTLGVKQQSTLIVYRDGKETGRSLGDTTTGSIKTLIDKAF